MTMKFLHKNKDGVEKVLEADNVTPQNRVQDIYFDIPGTEFKLKVTVLLLDIMKATKETDHLGNPVFGWNFNFTSSIVEVNSTPANLKSDAVEAIKKLN